MNDGKTDHIDMDMWDEHRESSQLFETSLHYRLEYGGAN